MKRFILACTLAYGVQAGAASGDPKTTIVGSGNEFLAAGTYSIQIGEYEEGICLTLLGLTRYPPSLEDRVAALSNLCAAHVAVGELNLAIDYCTQSLGPGGSNWCAYSNRAYAYLLKGMFSEATYDLDTAAVINSDAERIAEIRGMLNEHGLRPRISIKERQ